MKRVRTLHTALLALAIAFLPLSVFSAMDQGKITVGSKVFTESVILGEVLCYFARHAGSDAVHQR